MIVLLIFIIFFIIYCYQSEKTTVVRFISPQQEESFSNPNTEGLAKHSFKSIIIDSGELIKPKLKLYERSRQSTPSFDAMERNSLRFTRLGSHSSRSSRPVSSVSSISQDLNERRISILNIPTNSFDVNSSPCLKEESRESTPIRPLDPAYESQGPVHPSSSSFVPPFLLRHDEISLPPGYLSFNDSKF